MSEEKFKVGNEKFLALDITFGKMGLSKKTRQSYIDDIAKQRIKNPSTNRPEAAWTGDVNNNYELHNNPLYKELFSNVGRALKSYCKNVGVKYDKFDFYIVRSWGTSSNKGQEIAIHDHRYCNLSMVYYPKAVKNAGTLVLQPTNYDHLNEFIPNLFTAFGSDVLDLENRASNKWVSIFGDDDMFVIFPAKIPHSVEGNNNEKARYSIAIDIVATLKDTNNIEQCLPPLTQWSKI